MPRRKMTAAVSLTVLALALTACSGEVSSPAAAQPASAVTEAPAEPTAEPTD